MAAKLTASELLVVLFVVLIAWAVKEILWRIKVRKFINRRIDFFYQVESRGYVYNESTKQWERPFNL